MLFLNIKWNSHRCDLMIINIQINCIFQENKRKWRSIRFFNAIFCMLNLAHFIYKSRLDSNKWKCSVKFTLQSPNKVRTATNTTSRSLNEIFELKIAGNLIQMKFDIMFSSIVVVLLKIELCVGISDDSFFHRNCYNLYSYLKKLKYIGNRIEIIKTISSVFAWFYYLRLFY